MGSEAKQKLTSAILTQLYDIANQCIDHTHKLAKQEIYEGIEQDRLGYYDMALRAYMIILQSIDDKD